MSEVEPPNDSGEEPEDKTEPSSEAPATALDEVAVARQGRKWTKPFRWLRERRRRIRWKVLIARLLTWGLVAIAVFSLLLYTSIRIFVKADDIRSFVKAQVEEQTGGKLEIGGAEFKVLTGVKLSNVQFYPPASGDTRGFAHGGEINPIPLANFEALDVRYSVAKFFAGRIHIKALQLIGPEFHLKQVDGVWNFDSILAYRAVHFPPEPETPEDRAAEATKKSTGNDLLPFSPALIYMPVELLTQNVGIKNLRLDMIKEEKGQIAQIVMTNGVTFDMGVHWFGRASNIWFNMTSPFEHPLELNVTDGVRGEDGRLTGGLKQSLLVRTALNLHFEFENLKKINVDFANRLMTLETPIAGYQDLATFMKLRIAIADDYKGITFDNMDVNLADAITYELRGTIGVPEGNFDAIALKLKQKFNLDLKEAAHLAKPFVPGLTADGDISFDELKIEGTVEPAKFANIEKGVPLPYVSGVIWLEDLAVNYPGVGVTMEPLSGDVSLAAGPSLNGSGSQVDLAINMDIPKVDAEQKLSIGKVRAGVEDLTTKVTIRALWPEMIAPIFKVNAEAEHITASGDGIAAIDVPMYADIDADGRQDLARAAFSSNFELTDLMEFSAMADCQARCSKFRSSALGRMDSLQKLHSIVLPLGALLGMADVMPTKLTGAMDFQFAARGKLPDPTTTPVPDLLKQADVRFNSQFNLTKLNTEVPLFNVKVKNFETRVLASGTLQEQKIDLSQKFESVSLTLPPPKGANDADGGDDDDDGPAGMKVSVGRYALETGIVNTIDGPLNLAALLPQLSTSVDSHLFIGKVAVEGGPLPYPVSDIQIGVSLEQAHLTDIKIKEISAKLPDFGTTVVFSADTTIGPDYMPRRLKAKVQTNVVHSGDERLPMGIKTSGKVDINLEVDTPDMKTASIDGQTNFDKFNVMIPALDGKGGPPLLVVEEIKGQIPFKQVIQLPDLSKLTKPAPSPAAPAATAPTPSVASATTGSATATSVTTLPTPVEKEEIAEVKVADDGETPEVGDSKLDKLTGQYFAKNEDKLSANSNIIATVDYPNIRPFFPERRPISIKRLEAANLELTKMEFDLELRQNWFAVNQFVIGFLGGKIQGDFQLAFDSQAKEVKKIPLGFMTSVHMTRLDTRKMIERFPNLKGKSSSWTVFSNPYLDGTVHIKYDIRSNDLSGGVEITSIGKEQLRMMLFYVDPFEQNPSISDMRKALAFGEVRQVSIPIKNGEMGMDVDVRVLSAPIPTPKLTRFPISQLLQNFTDQMTGGDQSAKPAAAEPKTPPPPPETPPQVSGA